MDDEYAVEFTKISDESDYLRDGTTKPVKVYRFWIGRYGPFTERVPAAPFDPLEIDRRVTQLKMHLQTRPQ